MPLLQIPKPLQEVLVPPSLLDHDHEHMDLTHEGQKHALLDRGMGTLMPGYTEPAAPIAGSTAESARAAGSAATDAAYGTSSSTGSTYSTESTASYTARGAASSTE